MKKKEGKMKKELERVLFLVFLVCFCFFGFRNPVVAETKSDVLRIANPDFAYESMDPIYYESFWGWAMYDPLITYDEKGNFLGAVAESWKLSQDGKVFTFKIRKGIKFHNGDPLTAEDVAFSVVRFSSEESTNPWSPYLRYNFDSVETPDPYTFVYRCKRPEPTLLVPFAWTRILPKKYIEKVGVENFRKRPVGSGPWKFVKFISKTSMEMEANTEHWRYTPVFRKVIDLMIPEESTRIAMLKRGEVDIVLGLTLDRVVELQKEGFQTRIVGYPVCVNISFLGTWLTKGPTSDKRVRQAMSYAINREELSKTFYRGFARPGGRWFLHKGGYGWHPSLKADPYDPEKAKALLKEAGYPQKFSDPVIKIYVQPTQADLMQILAGYWEDVGIKTKIEVVDAVTWGGMFFNRVKSPEDPAVGAVFPWIFGSTFNSVYHAANMYKSTGVHSTGNDPKADELYTRAVSEIDPKKARAYFTEFQLYVKDMYVNVPVVEADMPIVVGPRVGEFKYNRHMSIYDALAGIQQKK